MKVELQRETLTKAEAALRAVIDQYADDDYVEGDSYAVRLARDAVAAIEAEPAWPAGLGDSPSACTACPTTDH